MALITALSILSAIPALAAKVDGTIIDEGVDTELLQETVPATETDEAAGLAASAALNAPAITSISNEATGAKLTWNGSAGKQYRLYRKDSADSEWIFWKIVTGTDTTDTSLADAQERWYTFSAANTPDLRDNEGWSNVYAPRLSTVKNTDDGVLLEWNVRRKWSTELTINNGTVTWSKPTS